MDSPESLRGYGGFLLTRPIRLKKQVHVLSMCGNKRYHLLNKLLFSKNLLDRIGAFVVYLQGNFGKGTTFERFIKKSC
jgi:hypothetical protein